MFSPRWHAIRTRSRAERMVRDALTHCGIDSFLPLMTRISKWKGRHKCIEWALFSGYCFAKFSDSERNLVTQAAGVLEIIDPAECRPAVILEPDIAAVRRIMACGQRYRADFGFEDGIRVEVLRGPLAGIQGKLIRKGDRCRLAIFIDAIGQGASVEIDAENTTLIDSSPSVTGGL